MSPTGSGRVKTQEVTRKDVQDAALIGQIVAEADLAKADAICDDDDDDCCGHMLVEHCVAKAVGASGSAVWLWLAVSNAIAAPLREHAEEVAETRTPAKRRRAKRLYAWVDSVFGQIAELGVAELHAAALLRDGILPPAWTVIPSSARLWSRMIAPRAKERRRRPARGPSTYRS